MFFQKKKDKEASSSSTAAAADKKEKKKEKEKDKKKEKEKAEPLSKEEMERLEETKTRLFGHLGKKKTNNKGDGAGGDSRTKPEPPPRSHLLKDLPPHNPPPVPPPIAVVSNDHGPSPLPSMWSPGPRGLLSPSSNPPSSPFDFANESVDFGFHPLKTFNLPGLSLPALAKTNLVERSLTLKRTSGGDFGFSLRRAQLTQRFADHTEQQRTVIFAEPLSMSAGLPSTSQIETGLLPGDQLLQVNGQSVEALTRDEVIRLIRDSADTVTLVVRPVPELSELTIRAQQTSEALVEDEADGDSADLLLPTTALTSRRKEQNMVAVNGALSSDEENRVWLAHKDGYALAEHKGPGDGEGKVRIRIEATGGEMVVDSDDIEKANPNELDRVEDISHLYYLNESSALHLLRQRFGSNLIHTYGGSHSTIIINPIQQLSFYHEKIVQMFKGCKREHMPPHIYAVAQQVYRNMQSSANSQSVVFSGRSGSGKSSQLRHFLHYLCLVAGSVNKLVTIDKLNAIGGLLEAFGNCRTVLNQNASRFASVVTLDFDHSCQISAGNIQGLLLECQRVVQRPDSESNFHVFYYLWEGCEEALRKELHLDTIEDPSAVISPLRRTAEKDTAKLGWQRLTAAFDAINVTGEEQKVLWSVLAAVFHLAFAEATRGTPSYKSQFVRASHAQRAAALLGVSVEELHNAVFRSKEDQRRNGLPQKTASPNARSDSTKPAKINFRDSLSRISITDRVGDGMEALNAFIVGLYQETFNLVISLVNRSLSSTYVTKTSITLIDCPGFQNPGSVAMGKKEQGAAPSSRRVAGFNDFCFNYVNERLHELYYNTSFTNPMEIYRLEQVDVACEEPNVSPKEIVKLLDKPSQQELINSTNIELRSQEKRGLLWLLDEESVFPGATDESFLERVFVHYGDRKDGLLRRSRHYNHIVLRHCLGTNPVTYNVSGWLRQAQENPVTRGVLSLLQDSQKQSLATLFLALRSSGLPGISASAVDSSASLRRATTVLKSLNNPQTLKRKSYCAMTKVQMDYVVETARRVNRTHFVHCLLPHAEAGAGVAMGQTDDGDNALINVPLLRQQIRGIQLLDSVRMNKIGYPERMPFSEFKRRFECLLPTDIPLSEALDDRTAVKHLLDSLEIDEHRYRLGLSQLLVRSDLLSQLDDKRDEKLSSMVIGLQAHCRSYLTRRRMERRKVQDLAIRCVQKNISKYMLVKSWPWWKLYTRVLPLLNVHRTDEELKERAEAIADLHAKIEKLERLCAELRMNSNRMEARMADAQVELTDERSTSAQTADALQLENEQRIRLEKEYTELKTKLAGAERKAQKLELETMEYRNVKSAMREMDDDEDAGNAAELKRQLDALHKQLEQERRETQELRGEAKERDDRKTSVAQKELAELRESEAALKRKAQKALEELQDVQMHLQKIKSRNAELEKKQRKFDQELKAARDVADTERVSKDRFLREKEEALAKIYRLDTDLRDSRDEKRDLEMKVDQMRRELDDVSKTTEGAVETELIALRRYKHELEKKTADQEEELDELAGKVQMLEQTVTRLEMQSERAKQDAVRDAEGKEHELEDIRAQHQRRVRAMEQQLQDEAEEKAILSRQKRELESRLREALDRHVQRDDTTESQLRRDLRKTTALLKDAQAVLAHYQDNAPSRNVIKQLKAQLEDAEFGKLSAVKARQSLEAELSDQRAQLDSALAAKALAEDRCMSLMKEKNGVQSQLDEHEDQLQQLLKKYKAQVQHSAIDSITLADQTQQIADLERDKEKLQEQLTELLARHQWQESHTVDKHKVHLADQRIRDLEAKLELEITQKQRHESLANKAKEDVEGLQTDVADLRSSRDRELEMNHRLKKETSLAQELLVEAQKREADLSQKNQDLERQLERMEQEHQTTMGDLKLAMRRVEGLQAVLQEDLTLDAIDEESADDDDDDDDRMTNGSVTGNGYMHWPARVGSDGTSPMPASTIDSSGPHRPGSVSSDSSCNRHPPQKASTPTHLQAVC